MNILFFSMPYPSFTPKADGYNGGGWVGSLLNQLVRNHEITASIAFTVSSPICSYERDGIKYYPIYQAKTKLEKWFDRVTKSPKRRDEEHVKQCMEVIETVKPDIIHLFGSESAFGLLAEHTHIPVVLHIQGIISPYSLALLPPGMSWKEASLGQKTLFWAIRQKKAWRLSADRERRIFQAVPHFIGRTQWDHILQKVLNPQGSYHYVSEIMRDPFYEPSQRVIPKNLKIVSTISYFVYKGFDVVLKTADVLKRYYGVNFEWHVFGNINKFPAEKATKISASSVNVILRGVAGPETIREELLGATTYFHPSYIDNSPNSVCEAQMLGVSVVAQNVGGVASLIDNHHTGILIPANDAFQGAYWINRLFTHIEENICIGNKAKSVAVKRHDKKTICEQLISCYTDILDNQKTE